MKKITVFSLVLLFMIFFNNNLSAKYEKLAYDFAFKDLDGSILNLSDYKNKVILVINVASQCGFTNQYEDLQKIWNNYQSKGLVVIGVPSNDFGGQEPGTEGEIKNFCDAKFGITFPMTEKVIVKGDNAHPFYLWAKKNYGKSAVPKWNFHKIVINKEGKIENTFASITNPSSKRFIKFIEKIL
jgi:glutathione peroxidase